MPDPTAESGASLLGDHAIELLIAKSTLFQNLDEEGRKRLLEGGSVENFGPGTVIMTEGDPGDSFFFIKTGAVEVATMKNGQKFKLADLAAGEFFGEVSVLLGEPPIADVVATRPLRCIVLGGPAVESFLVDHPRVMYRMLQVQARRLRAANRWRS